MEQGRKEVLHKDRLPFLTKEQQSVILYTLSEALHLETSEIKQVDSHIAENQEEVERERRYYYFQTPEQFIKVAPTDTKTDSLMRRQSAATVLAQENDVPVAEVEIPYFISKDQKWGILVMERIREGLFHKSRTEFIYPSYGRITALEILNLNNIDVAAEVAPEELT